MNKLFKDFDWKNGEFNDRQKLYLEQYAQNQIDNYLSGETDKKKAEKHLKAVYKQLGKKVPKVVWYDSPIHLAKTVGASVGASVRDSVRASVWASVRDSVRASVWASVRASVRDSVRASVRASVWAWYDANWSSFYKFFSDEFENNALENWCLFQEQVNGQIMTDDAAHLVTKPIRLVRNGDGRLHYDHDKAIEWADGTGFYYLNGVEFDEKTWEDIVEEKVTLETLGKIENADQRVVAVQMLRPDRLLKQVNARLIDTGKRGVELYEVPNFMDSGETEYCVKMQHPTIKSKFYIEWVSPEYGKQKSADNWMAFSRGLSVKQYLEAELA